MSNVMAALSNIGGASAQRRKVRLTRSTRVPCSNAANIGERKAWTQSEFLHLAKFRYRARGTGTGVDHIMRTCEGGIAV